MSGLRSRIMWTSIVYIFVVITSIFVSLPRFDIISVAFIAIVIIVSAFFSWRITKHTSLMPYTPGTFKEEATKVMLACIAVLATRYIVFYITGGIWEKSAMIVLTFMLITYIDRNKLIDYGLTIHFTGRQIVWALSSLFSVWCIHFLTYILMPMIMGVTITSFTFDLPHASEISIVTIILFLVGNFAEELFFRGYVQTKLKRFGLYQAIIIQSLFFALYHLNYLISHSGSPISFAGYIFFTFLFGIFMGLLFELSGSILVTTFIHAGANILFSHISIYPVSVLSDGSHYIYPLSYSTSVVVLIAILFFMVVAKQRQKT
jgi:membrane protease YdiL (CAAX protease family)